jgi:hypothetical protein
MQKTIATDAFFKHSKGHTFKNLLIQARDLKLEVVSGGCCGTSANGFEDRFGCCRISGAGKPLGAILSFRESIWSVYFECDLLLLSMVASRRTHATAHLKPRVSLSSNNSSYRQQAQYLKTL